jgi:choline monooxygenase
MDRGADDVGPYQSPMEDGMQHFHEWYRSQMGLSRPAP